jgi:hypothetical protein
MFCAHSVVMWFVWFSGTSSNYFLILVFITEIEHVYFVVQSESLNIIMLNFDLERLNQA